MSSGFDPLNLILLAVAIIVFWRLRSVLGQRTGLEKPPVEFPRPEPKPAAPKAETPVNTPATTLAEREPPPPVWKGYAAEGSNVAQGLAAIAGRMEDFTVKDFMAGAKVAYEMILEAFAKGDKASLKPLLSKEVYDSFAQAIDARAKAGQTMQFQFVGVLSAKLEQAILKANRASLTIDFVSQMISATKSASGEVVEGEENQIRDVADTWTFERDVTSRDPNWKLVATQENA